MCGRYITGTEDEVYEIRRHLLDISAGIKLDSALFSREAAPTDTAPVICRRGIFAASWGFSLYGKPVFNARSETMRESPLFSAATEDGRCIIPALCYFEWKKQDGSNIRYRIDGPMMLAGLMRTLYGKNEFTMLTAPAPGFLADIHSRSPVPLSIPSAREWLNGGGLNPAYDIINKRVSAG